MVAMVEAPLRTRLMTPAGRAYGDTAARDATGIGAVGVSAIAGRTNREGPRTRATHAEPERRVHEGLAQSARPRHAGTATVAQLPPAGATGRTVESANEDSEGKLRVLTSSQSPPQ